MNGAKVMGYLISVVIFLTLFCVFMLIFGEHGWWLFLGAIVIGLAIGWHKETPPHQNDNDSYFTDEDFMHCKIGEWVSRK